MSEHLRLLFFAGSSRKDSLNKKLAMCAAAIADEKGIAATFADLGDYPMPIYDGDLESADGIPENAHKLHALMKVHHGILIATPEYNSSISPLLKNTLDWISRIRDEGEGPYEVYRTRVFALCSAAPGQMGGIRGMTDVRKILELGVGALVLPEQLAVGKAGSAFGADGRLKDDAMSVRLAELVLRLHNAAGSLLTGPEE